MLNVEVIPYVLRAEFRGSKACIKIGCKLLGIVLCSFQVLKQNLIEENSLDHDIVPHLYNTLLQHAEL